MDNKSQNLYFFNKIAVSDFSQFKKWWIHTYQAMLLGSYPIPCPFMSCPFLLLHSTLEKQGKAMGIADTTLYLRQRMEISTAHQVHHLLTQFVKNTSQVMLLWSYTIPFYRMAAEVISWFGSSVPMNQLLHHPLARCQVKSWYQIQDLSQNLKDENYVIQVILIL